MAGRSGYGYRPPEVFATCGRFRKGHDYPERVATYFKKPNYKGYPSKEAYEQSRIDNRKALMEEAKKIKRREVLAREARDIQDLARGFSEEAMEIAMQIARNEHAADSARLQAIAMVHDRAYGKAAITSINTNINANAKPSEINGADLDKRITEAISRIERLARREEQEAESQERPTHLRVYN
jgi:hypothetical protein